MESSSIASLVPLIGIVLRVMAVIYCGNEAGLKNRDKTWWGVFGALLPLIAIIWIRSIKPKIDWDTQARINRKEDSND